MKDTKEDAHVTFALEDVKREIEKLDSYSDDEVTFVCDRDMKAELERSNESFEQDKGELHADSVGLDSMCSHPIFGNEDLLTDVQDCDPVRFLGMGGACNGRSHRIP